MDGIIRSIEKRNQIVEQYLWCIDVVIQKNYALIAGAHLDRQDVYQALAVRLIRAVDGYNSEKGKSLKVHIFAQLQYEILSCSSPKAKLGITNAPYGLRNAVISIEELAGRDPYWERALAA